MRGRRPRVIAVLFVLGVGLLGACQAPLRVDDGNPLPERPVHDDFKERLALEGAAGSVAGANVGATAEAGEPDHAGRPARRSVWWTWTAPSDGTVSFDARGSALDAVVGAYRGEALTELTPVAEVGGADAIVGWTAFEVAAGDVVAIAVDGLEGAAGTIALDWTLDAPEPEPDPDPVAPTLDLVLERLYVSQSVPAQDSAQPLVERVPLVAGRPGLLRVFVTANEPNAVRPIVRLHYRYAGGPEASLDLDGPASVPLAVDEGVLEQSFDVPLDADLVRPGLEAYVTVTLAGEVDTSDNRYPAAGDWVPEVVVAPDARFTLVPVTYRSATPDVGDGSSLLGLTERMLPLAGVDVEVRAPYAFTGDLDTGDGWSQLLQELSALRATDGSGRHYYGVVDPGYAGGIAGIGWVGYLPVAVGWSRMPSAASVATHELGHNWGRSHAPCGVGGEADYPYPDGVTGVWGFDRGTGELKAPTLADVMSYCNPAWVSDYTYEGVLDYRASYGYAIAGAEAAGPTTLLLASGRLEGDAVELDPLFVVDGVPLATGTGPFALVGRGADGRELLRVPFAAAEVSLGHDRAFQVAIPIAADVAGALASVAVERAGVVLAERRVGLGPLAAPTAPSVTREPDGRATIAWDAGSFAEVLVRDGVGGPVLGRDRTGRLSVRASGNELELLFSNGVTTQRRTVRF